MKSRRLILSILIVMLPVAVVMSIGFGAVSVSPAEIWSGITGTGNSLHERVLWDLRIPRVLMGILAGAALSVGGVLLQALFRNPIVEPGLIGTSSGAAFGASLYFVFGASLPSILGGGTLAIMAISGSALATLILLMFEKRTPGSEVYLLLAGIAINALFLSGVGFMSYLARDPQARSIAFWNLGTLSGASWKKVFISSLVVVPSVILSVAMAKGLNALTLGAEQAEHLGVRVRTFKWKIIGLQIALVAIVTSFTGVISFVGLVVPHLLRLWGGGEHRFLIRGSLLLGPVVVLFTDLLARLILQPAEIPLGIVTAVIGAPVFLGLLRRTSKTIGA